MTTNMLKTLAFYTHYDGWHSYDKTDRPTVVEIKSLVKRG